jgi:endonuclease YncB( thermonuclease family)
MKAMANADGWCREASDDRGCGRPGNTTRTRSWKAQASAAVIVFALGTITGELATVCRSMASERSSEFSAVIGRASVIDGDTIEIHGTRIRLNGIDAPESNQVCTDTSGKRYGCGRASANFLDEFLSHSVPARCVPIGTDRYGRMVADCYRADDADVASQMVRSGWALDWPKYSNGRFAADERFARSGRLGVWSGDFEEPWVFRQRDRK